MEEGLAFLKNMRSPEFRSGLISLHFVLAVKWLLLVMFEGLLVVSVVLVVLPMFFCVGGTRKPPQLGNKNAWTRNAWTRNAKNNKERNNNEKPLRCVVPVLWLCCAVCCGFSLGFSCAVYDVRSLLLGPEMSSDKHHTHPPFLF